MGKPAARMGDSTMHGGVIVVGFPMVLIGGQPASRAGDMHVCPMLNPGLPPPPHVGGPIMPPGAPGVLIGGQPAACIGDMVTCAGPPDTIAPPGCPTVLIGTGGGAGAPGGGSGGDADGDAPSENTEGSGVGATAGGSDSATGEAENFYLDATFVDKGGYLVGGLGYKVQACDGNEWSGPMTGSLHFDLQSAGNSAIELFGIRRIKWSALKVKVGEEVHLQVETVGIGGGTKAELEIMVRDRGFGSTSLKKLNATVDGDQIDVAWKTELDDKLIEKQREIIKRGGFSCPYYYFRVTVNSFSARSDLLYLTDDLEITLKNNADLPIADAEYHLLLGTGEARKGKLDSNGHAEEKDIPAGLVQVVFKKIPYQEDDAH